MKITGKDLIALDYKPAPWFSEALQRVNTLEDPTPAQIVEICESLKPLPVVTIPLGSELDVWVYSTETGDNFDKSYDSLAELSKTPTIHDVLLMPDACPAGRHGEITVGGVAAARNAIHPGMHSADICCSMMVSDFGSADPADVLDAMHSVTHFGFGGRNDHDEILTPYNRSLIDSLGAKFESLELLDRDIKSRNRLLNMVKYHAGTQGDGNHFAFVGTSEQNGRTYMVTHHGSRGVGAMLYKIGKLIAEDFRKVISPETLPVNAWIPFETKEGQEYWKALQLVREWTKANHNILHSAVERRVHWADDRFWNEHNFVFQEDDLFWHAKGSTPVNKDFLPDSDGRMAIPMNMSEPVLIVREDLSLRNSHCGFAPHGAGRMTSRTQHIRAQGDRPIEDILKEETQGLDVRFFSGKPDISELPSAYKDAIRVQADMEYFGLAKVIDRIMPYGCIMAGQQDEPWRKPKAKNKPGD